MNYVRQIHLCSRALVLGCLALHRLLDLIQRRPLLKGNSLTKSSTYELLLLSKTLGGPLCGGVDFLKPINKCIVSDKTGAGRRDILDSDID